MRQPKGSKCYPINANIERRIPKMTGDKQLDQSIQSVRQDYADRLDCYIQQEPTEYQPVTYDGYYGYNP